VRVAPRAWIALLVAGAVFGVYWQVRTHDFVNFDDPVYIVDNPHLQDGFSAAGIAHDFVSIYHLNWHPLTSVSYRIDYELYGLDAPGYLFTNVILHALAAAILYLALARMTRAPGRSAFVAAVFALHPLHVESVAWASERKDVLSGAFFSLTLLAYARYAEAPSSRRMGAVAAFLGLGLLSKSVLVTAPFVLVLIDYWPLGRIRREDGSALPDAARLRTAIVEKWPLFALSAAASAATWLVQASAGALTFGDELSFGIRATNALHSYGAYLIDTAWPTGLAVFYPHPGAYPGADIPAARVALAAASLTAITAVVASCAARRPYLIAGWLWYLGMLVPMIGLVQVGQQARADRYMYLPLIGLALAVAWGACDLARGRRSRRVLGVAAAAALLLLGVRSWDQVGIWRDSRTLFEHALAVTERNFKAHVGLGDTLQRGGLYAEAVAQYSAAIELYPRWVKAHLGRAGSAFRMGDLAAAAESYERALEIHPDQPAVRGDLGVVLVKIGRVDEGLRELDRLIEDGEASADVFAFLADRSFEQGRPGEAVAYYREALIRDEGHPAATNNLAWLLATARDPGVRDPAEAVAHAERAALRDGSDPRALDTLAAAYAAAGRYHDAVRVAAVAREGAPDGSPLAAELESRLELYRSGRAVDE
jgi:tetratricopeptide (TPR) repeat protein